jgi:hypothetical protein
MMQRNAERVDVVGDQLALAELTYDRRVAIPPTFLSTPPEMLVEP